MKSEKIKLIISVINPLNGIHYHQITEDVELSEIHKHQSFLHDHHCIYSGKNFGKYYELFIFEPPKIKSEIKLYNSLYMASMNLSEKDVFIIPVIVINLKYKENFTDQQWLIYIDLCSPLSNPEIAVKHGIHGKSLGPLIGELYHILKSIDPLLLKRTRKYIRICGKAAGLYTPSKCKECGHIQ